MKAPLVDPSATFRLLLIAPTATDCIDPGYPQDYTYKEGVGVRKETLRERGLL